MTFGMMFGARPTSVDEWSTDDDEDGDIDGDYDDDEDDEDYLIEEGTSDEYLNAAEMIAAGGSSTGSSRPSSMYRITGPITSGSPQLNRTSKSAALPAESNSNSNSGAAKKSGTGTEVWEPQVKQYSNMNLKDQVKKERQTISQPDEPPPLETISTEELEREKKLKQTKKRAEKRKKQKEKNKLKEKSEAQGSGSGNNGELGTINQHISAMNLDSPEFRR